MPTVSNKFNRYVKRHDTGVTETSVMTSVVPANTDMVVMGLIVTNIKSNPGDSDLTDDPVIVNVMLYDNVSLSNFYLIKGNRIPEGESLVAIGWDQKLVLKPGDNIKVSTNAAGEDLDVTLSVLEILTTP